MESCKAGDSPAAPIWIFLFPLRHECTTHMFAVSHLVAQKWVGEIVEMKESVWQEIKKIITAVIHCQS